jgi:hypothetical protein
VANANLERAANKNEEKLRAEGKWFFDLKEQLACFRWLIRKLHEAMTENITKNNANDEYESDWTLQLMSKYQPIWLALTHILLAGQRYH